MINKTHNKDSLIDNLAAEVNKMPFASEEDKKSVMERLLSAKNRKINILITGSTGCGKSSTINALFDTQNAKVGMGSDPETMSIKKYEEKNLILWDSPGFGDGIKEDEQHAKGIIKLLHEVDKNNAPLIDVVLVIIDGSSRDYGTTYRLLEQVIIPSLGRDESKRILVAINQADVAMKGRHWDVENNKPEPILVEFLQEKVKSTQQRIKESTGVNIEPIFYSAGYQDESGKQLPYNLSKLLYFIVQHVPSNKRYIIPDNMNKSAGIYKQSDEQKKYIEETKLSFAESLLEVMGDVTDGIANAVEAVSDVVNTAIDIGKDIVSSVGSGLRSAGQFIGRLFGF